MQDSGLRDMRLLARLLQVGTLVLDAADNPAFASRGACELFGVPDLDALREQWPALRAQWRVGEWPRTTDDEPHCGRADLVTPAGLRSIRFEVHPMARAQGHRAVLVRDRARILPGDRALLLASEAQANRHVLNGLVHAAKGPLNNFQLTLALLGAGAARSDTSVPDVLARRKRYVDVLQGEVARMSTCIDEVHALTLQHDPAPEPIDLAAMARDCARVLRHGATTREIRLDLDTPDTPVVAFGDAQLVRLAFLSFAIAMIELTSAGGRVGWRVGIGHREPAWVVFDTTEPSLPTALCTALFRLSCTAESDYSSAIAARLVIEAQQGEVILQDGAEGRPAILLRIPARD